MTFSFVCRDGSKGTTSAEDVQSCLDKLAKNGMDVAKLYQNGKSVWVAEDHDMPVEPQMPLPRHLKVQAESLESIGEMPVPMPTIVQHVTMSEVEAAMPRRRRQSFIMGEQKAVKGLIDNALAMSGKVIHMSVNSDIKGALIVSMVIDHEEENT